MSKRKITAAAKRRGLSVVDAHYEWTATPGEMVPGWQVQFGSEIDELYGEDEHQDFESTAQALEWIDGLNWSPSEAEVLAWRDRYDLGGALTLSEARTAIEDARSLHMLAAAAPQVPNG